MKPEQLISECRQSGIFIRIDGDAIKLRGDAQAVKAAALRLRPHKAELFEYLARSENNDAGICGPYTPYCCPISSELVTELHKLIARYGQLYSLSIAATARIIEAAKKQPLASVPAGVMFFTTTTDKESRPSHRD